MLAKLVYLLGLIDGFFVPPIFFIVLEITTGTLSYSILFVLKLFIKKSDSRFAFVRFVNHTHDYRLHSVIFSLLMLLTDIYSETCVVYGIVRL